ncbi:MAG: thioredoxin [Clostridia bacterium]|nr:thioredoxin [Clostridia bacterium]
MKKQPRVRGVLLLIAGLTLLVAGVLRGEAEVVLRKAVNLCMECIGIG